MRDPHGTEHTLPRDASMKDADYQTAFTFIGSQRLFSDIVLRTIESEFPGVRASRFPDVATWTLVASTQAAGQPQLRLLIVDERQSAALMPLLEHRNAQTEGVNIALAVREDCGATELMAHWGALLSEEQVSILPMNLNLNAWIQLIRLLDCGAHYLPSSAYATPRAAPPGAPPPQKAQTGLAGTELPCALGRGGPDGPSCTGGVARLTPREREVLKLVAAGRPNKVIANDLAVSSHTVKLHIHRIMAKLGVSNRTEAAICYHHCDG